MGNRENGAADTLNSTLPGSKGVSQPEKNTPVTIAANHKPGANAALVLVTILPPHPAIQRESA